MPASNKTPGGALVCLLGLLTVLSFWRLGDLGRFMLDASSAEHAISPHVRRFQNEGLNRPFFPRHNCFTSYVVAQQLALEGEPNIYGPDLYREPARETPVHAEIGELLYVDRYQYPPPFLLLPWALTRIGGGFFGARGLFYFLNLATFLVSLWCAQRWLRGAPVSTGVSGRVWAAWPLVLLATTTLTTLQIGNVHALVMMLSVLGMLAVCSERHALGGALLGFVTFGKIFPGILLVYLAARGKKRAVLWSLAWGLLYMLLTVVVFGTQPFHAFFDYQLGRLASGEAFDFAFRIPHAMLVNSSFTGIAYRLQQLGVLEHAGQLARVVSWGAGFLLIGCAWIWGRAWRQPETSNSDEKRYAEHMVWLALLLLAQMRSPFLPWGYGSFVVLWLLALLLVAPRVSGGSRTHTLLLLPMWILLSASLPLPFGGPTLGLDYVVALSGTMLAIALAFFAVLRGRLVLARADLSRTE